MKKQNYSIDCWAFYGNVEWDIESVREFISSAERIYGLFGIKATQYGFCENPYGAIRGVRMGSARNVANKVETIYSKNVKLKTLEFFSLPKDYSFQYSDYDVYLARSKDFILIGYDIEKYPNVHIEHALAEMKKQLTVVWGEHFQITAGNQPYVYCAEQYEANPLGNHLVSDTYIEKFQPIHVIEQFNVRK